MVVGEGAHAASWDRKEAAPGNLPHFLRKKVWLEKLGVIMHCAQMNPAASPWQSAEVLITNNKSNAQDATAYSRSRHSIDADTSREHRLQPEPLKPGNQLGEPEASTSRSSGNRLYWWDEVPNVLQFNKYVRSGYRAGLNRRQCVCSILQLHNETGNIHSHLLPALLLVALLVTEAVPVWPKAKIAFIDSVIPSLLCLSGSVCYHTLMPDHRNYKRYLMIDMCGVFLVLVCGAGSGIYWGLLCYPSLRTFFLAAYYLSAVACVVAGVAAKTQMGRAVPMLGLLGVRGSALATRMLLGTGSQAAAYHYLAMEATGLAGALINVLRVPEKWLFPRAGPLPTCRKASFFDYWLNSHQLMHVLVLLAMVFKYLGTSADYRHRVGEGVGC